MARNLANVLAESDITITAVEGPKVRVKTAKATPAVKAITKAGLKVTKRGNRPIEFENEIVLTKTGAQSAKGLPCLFSGEQTITPKARFLPGFDAKLKSVLLKVEKGEVPATDIPALARQWMQKEPLVGFRMEGDRLVRSA